MALKSKLAIAAGKSSYWFLHNVMHSERRFRVRSRLQSIQTF